MMNKTEKSFMYENLLKNASKEKKGDAEIARFYVKQIRDIPEALTPVGYEALKSKILEILKIN